jgi:hypothetical protein
VEELLSQENVLMDHTMQENKKAEGSSDSFLESLPDSRKERMSSFRTKHSGSSN